MTELEKANIIITEVCKYLKQDRKAIMVKTNKREIVEARQLSYYFINKNTTLSLQSAADLFRQNHSTAIHGRCVVTDLIQFNGYGSKATAIAARIKLAFMRNDKGLTRYEFRLKRIRFHYRAMRAKAGRLRAICTASKLLAEVNIESF